MEAQGIADWSSSTANRDWDTRRSLADSWVYS